MIGECPFEDDFRAIRTFEDADIVVQRRRSKVCHILVVSVPSWHCRAAWRGSICRIRDSKSAMPLLLCRWSRRTILDGLEDVIPGGRRHILLLWCPGWGTSVAVLRLPCTRLSAELSPLLLASDSRLGVWMPVLVHFQRDGIQRQLSRLSRRAHATAICRWWWSSGDRDASAASAWIGCLSRHLIVIAQSNRHTV